MWPLMLLVRGHDCCHDRAGAAIATEFSIAVKHRLATSVHVHRDAVTTTVII